MVSLDRVIRSACKYSEKTSPSSEPFDGTYEKLQLCRHGHKVPDIFQTQRHNETRQDRYNHLLATKMISHLFEDSRPTYQTRWGLLHQKSGVNVTRDWPVKVNR